MKEYCIQVKSRAQSREAVDFLVSLGFDRNFQNGDAINGYYYTTTDGKINCTIKNLPLHLTIHTLESLKTYLAKDKPNPDPIFQVGDIVVFKDLDSYSHLASSIAYKNEKARIISYSTYKNQKSLHSDRMIEGYTISVSVITGEREGISLCLNECDFVKQKSNTEKIYDLEKDLADLTKQHNEVKQKEKQQQQIITINSALPYEKDIITEKEQKIVIEIESLLSINQNN